MKKDAIIRKWGMPMPTDIQFKDDLRKEEIRIEDELELLANKEYDKLKKKLERDLKRVKESLQD